MSILSKPATSRPYRQREETMPLHDCCYSVPMIASPISYKLSISMMKRLITTTHRVLSSLLLVVGLLATVNSFLGLL